MFGGLRMQLFVKAACAAIGALAGFISVPLYAQSRQLDDLLKKQQVLGTFGNWMAGSGYTSDGYKYCAATSMTASDGGRIALRVLPTSPGNVEWRVFPSTDDVPGKGLSEIEAKKEVLADIAPMSVARAGSQTIKATAWIGRQSFQVTFTVITVGRSQELQNRYWWLTELEKFEDFEKVGQSLANGSEMKIDLLAKDTPEIRVSMAGFPDALEAISQCSGAP
jgi:hypothetical protein